LLVDHPTLLLLRRLGYEQKCVDQADAATLPRSTRIVAKGSRARAGQHTAARCDDTKPQPKKRIVDAVKALLGRACRFAERDLSTHEILQGESKGAPAPGVARRVGTPPITIRCR
jgi:hypothetical protein